MFGMAPSLFKFTFTFFKELLDCMKVKIKVRKDHFIYNRERERFTVRPASSSFKYLLRKRGFIIAPVCSWSAWHHQYLWSQCHIVTLSHHNLHICIYAQSSYMLDVWREVAPTLVLSQCWSMLMLF